MTQNPKSKCFNFGYRPGYARDGESSASNDDQERDGRRSDYNSARPKVGEPFSPLRRFHVLPMPDPLLQDDEIPPAAKLIYGRLCRYAREKTFAFPTPATLAAEVGLGERQVQKHLSILERRGFLRREPQFRNGKQTSNRIVLLWHKDLDDWAKEHPRKGEQEFTHPEK